MQGGEATIHMASAHARERENEELAQRLWEEAEVVRVGVAGPEDAQRVVELYRKAASLSAGQGSAAALATLARMHEIGYEDAHSLVEYSPPADAVAELGWLLRWVARGIKMLPSTLAKPLLSVVGLTPTHRLRARPWVIAPNITEAVRLYNASAALGNATAQFTMGVLHSTGLFGVAPDEARAVLYEFFAAAGGNAEAELAMATRHTHGQSVPKSCTASTAYFQLAAARAAESVTASHELLQAVPTPMRMMLTEDSLDDVSVRKPGVDSQILALYHHAADRGDVQAHVALGHLYMLGARGAPRDFILASEHFHAAAEHGDALSLANLGYLYFHGLGVAKDQELAHTFTLQAIKEGAPSAINMLGYMHLHGVPKILEQDYTKAWELFQKAAKASSVDAHYNIALMLLDGTAPTGRDFRQAFQHLQAGATQGHVKSLYKVGMMHLHGVGTGKDCASAQRAFRTAVHRLSLTPTLDNAYNLVATGNYPAAVLEYGRAAEMGYELGLWNAAILLERGAAHPSMAEALHDDAESDTGSETSVSGAADAGFLHQISTVLFAGARPTTSRAAGRRALRLRVRSASYGNGMADLTVGDAYFYGSAGLNVSFSDAAERYQSACSHRVAQGCFNMGYMHEYGLGVQRDAHLAKRFYDLCIEHQLAQKEPAPVPVQMALFRMKLASSWDASMSPYVQHLLQMWGISAHLRRGIERFGKFLLSAAPPSSVGGFHPDTMPPPPQPSPAAAAPETAPHIVEPSPSTVPASVADTPSPSIAASPPAPLAPEDRMKEALQRARAARVQRQQEESLSNALLSLLYKVMPFGTEAYDVFATASYTLIRGVSSVSGVGASSKLSKEDSAIIVLCVLLVVVLYITHRRRQAAVAGADAGDARAQRAAGMGHPPQPVAA